MQNATSVESFSYRNTLYNVHIFYILFIVTLAADIGGAMAVVQGKSELEGMVKSFRGSNCSRGFYTGLTDRQTEGRWSGGEEIYPALSLVQLLHCSALIGRELQSVEIFS